MKLLLKQEHITFYLKDKITTEALYGGAAGGGKTAFGCLWLIECCQMYAGSRWLMGRSKLKALKETTLNTFFEIASELNINDQFNFNAQSNIIYFKNGSEILLKDLFLYPSDPLFDSLGSLEIAGAFIDECNQITFKAWQTVKSRIRYKLRDFCPCGCTEKVKVLEFKDIEGVKLPVRWICSKGHDTTGLIPKQLGTCNPAKNWTYKEFYKPSAANSLKEYRAFVQALPTDNPHLPASYLESLLQLDKNSRERLYYGNWEYDDDPSTLIDTEAITDYFNPVHVLPTSKKYISIDVARKGKDKSIIRVWFGWLCTEVVEIDKNTITELAAIVRTLQAKHGISNSHTVADEDGVGGGLVDVLRCDGFVNNSKALNGENYENLKSQCSVIMANKIQLRLVGETNTQGATRDIIGEEMEQIKLKDIDKDGRIGIISKDVIKANIGRSPDHWDSIMMRVYFELKPRISKPTSRLI